MKNTPDTTAYDTQRGVALLFVVLLTSVLFMVAIGIANIAYKELAFSAQARDSDIAFFAADTGIECGLYLNNNYPTVFPTSGGVATTIGPGGSHLMTCNGKTLHVTFASSVATFAIDLGKECATVTVDKTVPIVVLGVTHHVTTVTSKGYNVPITSSASSTCLPTVGASPNNLVDRVLQASFVQ